MEEHEETGRFLPLTQVKTREDLTKVIADVSALLHLMYCGNPFLR